MCLPQVTLNNTAAATDNVKKLVQDVQVRWVATPPVDVCVCACFTCILGGGGGGGSAAQGGVANTLQLSCYDACTLLHAICLSFPI